MPSRTWRQLPRSMNQRRSTRMARGLASVAASAGLFVAAAPAGAQTPALLPLLNQGSTGNAVSRLQRALHINVSGRFGPATERAVIAFQRSDALSVDGIVGPQT